MIDILFRFPLSSALKSQAGTFTHPFLFLSVSLTGTQIADIPFSHPVVFPLRTGLLFMRGNMIIALFLHVPESF